MAETRPHTTAQWRHLALDALEALRLADAHLKDVSKSNPGYMGKLCLQDYALWNEASIKRRQVITAYAEVDLEAEMKLLRQIPEVG